MMWLDVYNGWCAKINSYSHSSVKIQHEERIATTSELNPAPKYWQRAVAKLGDEIPENIKKSLPNTAKAYIRGDSFNHL
ncbi:MAG: hypothetical protein U9N36_09600 [Euryarchaeota archaeon]|nr:hypothetical protein [Euryarchaeota archaeon]